MSPSVRTSIVAAAAGIILLAALSAPVSAQWLNYPTPGIPRNADGKANLTAPTPRAADGKPDLQGIWLVDGIRLILDFAQFSGSVPFQPWAEELYNKRKAEQGLNDPESQCLPQGTPKMSTLSWEGDTFRVDSNGFSERMWFDTWGHPHTEALHVIERFRRTDFGHMIIDVTIDDPKAYTRPWTATIPTHFLPDTELLEFVCAENNLSLQHMIKIK